MTRPTRPALVAAIALIVTIAAAPGAFAQEVQISDSARQLHEAAARQMAEGDFGAAKAQLETLIKVEAGFARGYFDLGYCDEQLGDLAGAASSYMKASELDPNNTDYAYSAGKAFYRAKDYEAGLQALTPHATDDQSDGRIWLQLGRTQEKLKMYDQASASAAKAVEIDPESGDAYYTLGSIEYDRNKSSKQYDLAISSYTKAIELAPDHTSAFAASFKLGRMNHRLKKYAEAEAFYNKAIEIRPDYAPAYVALGDSQAKRDAGAAIASYEKAIELKAPETYGMAYYKLAPIYFEQEEPEKALDAYEKSLTDPKFRYADKARAAMASIEDYVTKKKQVGSGF